MIGASCRACGFEILFAENGTFCLNCWSCGRDARQGYVVSDRPRTFYLPDGTEVVDEEVQP